MKIWELDSDRNGYDTLSLKNREEDSKYLQDFNGRTISEWKEIHFVHGRIGKRSDIPDFISGIPIFSENTKQFLLEFLFDQQILPVFFNQDRYYVINVTRIIDCIDYNHAEPSKLRTGHITGFKKYAFKIDLLHNVHIFKIPELVETRVFVSDAFRNQVLEKGLQGFRFIEAWDSEDDGSAQRAEEESFKRHLQRIEEEKGEEFSYIPAMNMVNEGKAIASGKYKLQKDRNDKIMMGILQPDGTYAWIDPYTYPPLFHEYKWHLVERHDI